MKYSFEVWVDVHKTVEIEAENRYDAFKKMRETLYDVDMSDATEFLNRMYMMLRGNA